MSDKQDPQDPKQDKTPGTSLLGDILERANENQDSGLDPLDELDPFVNIDDEDDLNEGEPDPEPASATTRESEPQKPEESVAKGSDDSHGGSEEKKSNIIDLASGKIRESQQTAENPLLTNDVRDDAAMLRRMSANGPVITGQEASLVQFNSKTGRIEPVDSDAAATLKAMGDSADLYISRPPQSQLSPMAFNPETFSLEKNLTKKVRDFPKATEAQEGMANILPPATAEDRVKRMTNQVADEDRKAQRDVGDNPESRQERQPEEENQPHLNPGAMLLNGVGQSISSLFSMIKKFLEWAVKKISAGAAVASATVAKTFSGLRSKETQPKQTGEESFVAPSAAATQYAQNSQDAGNKLKEQVEGRKQNLHAQAMNTTEGYRNTMTSQVKTIGEALGVHRAGSTLIRSGEEYNQRLSAATPNEKARVASAQKAISEQSEHFRDKLESVIQHRDMNLIPMADRQEILSSMHQSVNQPIKLTKMEQAVLKHGNTANAGKTGSMEETVKQALKQANTSVREATEKLKNQQAIESVNHAVAETETGDASLSRTASLH